MMCLVRCLRLLHIVAIKRSSRPSINPFLVIGHIAEKHYIYIMRENICGDVLHYLPWNSKNITLLYKCFLLIFLVQDQRSGFHVWGSLHRIKKAKIEEILF